MLREIVEGILVESSKNGLYVEKRIKKYYKNDKLHRDEKDGPAMIFSNGDKYYYKNGYRHRDNGPAAIWADGTKKYFQKGELNRDEKDGPAVIWKNGTTMYYKNGKHHRTNGPAVIWADGTVEFWLNDKEIEPGTKEYNNFEKKYGKKHPEWFK